MDATYKPTIVCGCLLAALCGCYPMSNSPDPRPVQPALVEPQPPSAVVGAATGENGEAELVSETIQQYIRRIDDVGSLAQRSRLREERETPSGTGPPPTQGLPDMRPSPIPERRLPIRPQGRPTVDGRVPPLKRSKPSVARLPSPPRIQQEPPPGRRNPRWSAPSRSARTRPPRFHHPGASPHRHG